MYKSEHFELYELLPEYFYGVHKHKGDTLWLMFDDRVLWTADQLWKLYGPTVIANDWYWGGKNRYRGWRPWNCEIGADLSQHKFGRALDQKFKYVTAKEVRQDIKNDPWKDEFKYITCIEDNTNWLHFDVRNWLKEQHGLLIIKG